MKKRFATLGLFVTFCFSLAAPAMASEQNIQAEAELELQIQWEVEAKKEAVHESLYEQLEAQDALILLDTFEALVYPDIEQSVRAGLWAGAICYKHILLLFLCTRRRTSIWVLPCT